MNDGCSVETNEARTHICVTMPVRTLFDECRAILETDMGLKLHISDVMRIILNEWKMKRGKK